MKKFLHFMLLMVAAVFAVTVVSCSSDDNDGEEVAAPVTVSVADGDILDRSVTVTVTPSAQEGDWYCVIYPTTEVADVPDLQLAYKVRNMETQAEAKQGTQTITFTNLNPKTAYTVVAFGWNGKENSTVVRHEVTTTEEIAQQIASQYFDVDYWGDVYHKGYDNFIIYFGDAPHESIHIKGLGTIYTLSIYNATKADASNPMPQEGTYTLTTADEPSDFCIEPSESQRFLVTVFNNDDDYTLKSEQLQDAKATIKKNSDGTWTLDAVIVDPDGVKKEFTYTGAVNVKDRSFKGYTGPVVDHDVDFVADYCPGYNYAGTQFEIMDGGDPDADNASWFNRNRVTIRLAAEKDAEGNNVPPVGTFEVSSADAPGYVLRGDYVDLGSGAEGPDGTYYYFFEKPSFKQYYAFVHKGSVTIAKGENNEYTVKCNFTTEQGKKLTASYTGTFPTTFASAANQRASVAKQGNARLPRK